MTASASEIAIQAINSYTSKGSEKLRGGSKGVVGDTRSVPGTSDDCRYNGCNRIVAVPLDVLQALKSHVDRLRLLPKSDSLCIPTGCRWYCPELAKVFQPAEYSNTPIEIHPIPNKFAEVAIVR